MRDWLNPDDAFSADDRRYFAERRAETNNARVPVVSLGFIVASLCAGIVQVMHTTHSHGEVLRREGMLTVDAVGIIVAAAMLAISRTKDTSVFASVRQNTAEILSFFLIVCGACSTASAQYSGGSLHEWAMAAVVPAAFLYMRLPMMTLTYLLSAAIIAPAIWLLRPGDPERVMNLAVLGLFALAMMVLSRTLWRQQVLDAAVRLDFERLNLSLDSQVQEQLDELNEHNAEVERLNAVLSERVRETSKELSAALSRLSRGEAMAGPLVSGTVLGNRVSIEQVIGRGGMGIVYHAWDRVTESPVAVKVVNARSEDELETMFRTLREAEAIATLRHPAIVRTEHVGLSDDGRLFIVLELVEGRTLSVAMTKELVWSQGRVARLGAVLADALDRAHTAGVVHRDMKPENIMLIGDAPGVKLLDFGLAKLREQHDVAVTGPERILGTPEYLSPEQVVDPSTIGPATDIYGLGLILYRLLAGRAPFAAKSASEWIARHAFAQPAELPQSGSTDAEMAALVMRCLEKAPGDRPSAKELRNFFNAFAERMHEPPIEASELARGARKRSKTTPTGLRAVVRREIVKS